METGPSGSALGLAVRFPEATQQAAGPAAGGTARGRWLHACSSKAPTSGRNFMDSTAQAFLIDGGPAVGQEERELMGRLDGRKD